jgi:hypothetical protein
MNDTMLLTLIGTIIMISVLRAMIQSRHRHETIVLTVPIERRHHPGCLPPVAIALLVLLILITLARGS